MDDELTYNIISRFCEQKDNENVLELQRKFSVQNEDQEEEKIHLVENFVKNELEQLIQKTLDQREEIVSLIYEILLSHISEREDMTIIDSIYWEVFHSLIQLLEDESKVIQDKSRKLFERICHKCNPREVFLLLLEALEANKTLSPSECTRYAIFINSLAEVMKRFSKEKRHHFLESGSHSLVQLLRGQLGLNNIPSQYTSDTADTFEGSDISVAIQGGNQIEESFFEPLKFPPHIVEVTRTAIRFGECMLSIISDDDQSKSSHLVAWYLFNVLECLAACQIGVDTTHEWDNSQMIQWVMKLLSEFDPALLHQLVLNEKDQLEENITVQFSQLGVSAYLCFAVVSGYGYFPTILSPSYVLLQAGIRHGLRLLRCPPYAHYGLELLHFLTCAIPHSFIDLSQDEEDIESTSIYTLIQELIVFMVNCPSEQLRNHSFKLIPQILRVIDSTSRLNLLCLLVLNCPYTSISSLLLYQVKQMIDSESVKAEEIARVLELLEQISIPNDVLNRMDMLMASLNFYRYLLIREKKQQVVGLWEAHNLDSICQNFLFPLEKEIDSLLLHLSNPIEAEQENTLQMARQQFGLQEITSEQIAALQLSNQTSLQLLRDTVERVKELISGAAPLTGNPAVDLSNKANLE